MASCWVGSNCTAHRGDPLDADAAERVHELLQHHAHTVGDGLGVAGLTGMNHRPLEVVEDRQELAQQLFAASLQSVFELATGALAEVVEVGSRAKELITHARDLGLGLFERVDHLGDRRGADSVAVGAGVSLSAEGSLGVVYLARALVVRTHG